MIVQEEAAVRELRARIRSRLNLSGSVSDETLMRTVEDTVLQWEDGIRLTSSQKVQLVRRLFHSFRGLDVLQSLMDDPGITEIMINSHEEIFIEQGGRLVRVATMFESRERLEDLIQAVVAGVNRVVNESTPIVDARLSDGSRVHVVLPPVALKGPAMTIRKFPDTPLLMDNLIELEAVSTEAADFLRQLVKAKYNIFISGGTGSGKTTFLNALSQYIPADERIVTIEDSAELQIRSVPNLVSLETRNANTEGKGEIAIRDLIRASLRMRPSRIIVGEVRGGEALDMLAAMNTGHAGSMSSGHSNGAKDMVSRLETMVMSAAELPIPVIRNQIASAIDIIVHLDRLRDRSRKVTEICEVTGYEEGEVRLQTLFQFVEEGERNGKIIGGLRATGSGLRSLDKWRMAGLPVHESDGKKGKSNEEKQAE